MARSIDPNVLETEIARLRGLGLPSQRRIKPGTKLIRVWQDTTHTVTVLADGFEWQGRRYRSLSVIARTITGTRWNGLVFFGVKSRLSDSGLPLLPK